MLAGLAALLGAGLALAVALSAVLTAVRLRRPPRRTAAWAASRGVASDPGELDDPAPFTTAAIQVDGSSIELWEIDGNCDNGPVVIVTPGWGDSRLGALPRLGALRSWASRIIAWDPPGLGASAGRCGLGVRESVMIRALCERYANEQGVVLYGWSLGGGASIAAGESERVVGVIAEAPYRVAGTPARNVLRAAGLPYRLNLPLAMWLLGTRLGVGPAWRGFDRAVHSARLSVPVLVIHGTDDAVCPVEDGRAIAKAAAHGSIAEIAGGGHNDLWSNARHRDACERAVSAFAEGLTGSPASSPG